MRTAFPAMLLLVALAGTTTVLAQSQAIDRATLEQRRAEALMRDARFAPLRREAYGTDFARAMAAIEKLREHGDEAQHIIQGAVRNWLERDERTVRSHLAALGKAANIREREEKVLGLQTKARENIAVLEKGEPVQLAHQLYEQLEQEYAPLMTHYGAIYDLVAICERQPVLLELRRASADPRASLATDRQETLRAQVEEAIGMTIAEAVSIRDGGEPGNKTSASKQLLWRYLQCRRIEAYNESVADMFKPAELENARLVNRYREHIGLLPLEWDARLTQAARAHSQEMHELGYFSHESPTEENRTFGMRCLKAGYQGATGENIAAGTTSGRRAFWMWFDSPGHHKNMAGGHNAIGVGLHADKFTQNFGGGPRLMDAKR